MIFSKINVRGVLVAFCVTGSRGSAGRFAGGFKKLALRLMPSAGFVMAADDKNARGACVPHLIRRVVGDLYEDKPWPGEYLKSNYARYKARQVYEGCKILRNHPSEDPKKTFGEVDYGTFPPDQTTINVFVDTYRASPEVLANYDNDPVIMREKFLAICNAVTEHIDRKVDACFNEDEADIVIKWRDLNDKRCPADSQIKTITMNPGGWADLERRHPGCRLEAILVHEFLHCLGLRGHSLDTSDIMYYSCVQFDPKKPPAKLVNGEALERLRALYRMDQGLGHDYMDEGIQAHARHVDQHLKDQAPGLLADLKKPYE